MQYLNIGGRKRPLFSNIGVIRRFAAHKGIEDLAKVEQALQGVTLDDIAYLLYLLLYAGAKREGIETGFSQEDVLAWFDDMELERLEEISNVAVGAFEMGKPQAVKEPQAEKAKP